MLLANQQEVAMLARLSRPVVAEPEGPEPFVVPDLADVSPELRQLLDQQDALKARKIELETELQASMEAWRKNERKPRVTDILAGRLPKRRIEYRTSQEIADDIADVKSAVDELDARIVQVRHSASAAVREMIAPEHQRLVWRMASAMMRLHATWSAYKQFADTLNEKRIAWSALRPMHPNWLGDPNYRDSPIAVWLREAVEYGLLDRAVIDDDVQMLLYGEVKR